MEKVLYKVYCGKTGKYYTYSSLGKAENLFYSMQNQNYHSKIIEIKNKEERLLREHL